MPGPARDTPRRSACRSRSPACSRAPPCTGRRLLARRVHATSGDSSASRGCARRACRRRIGRGAAPVRAAPRARKLDVIPQMARRREQAVVGGVAHRLPQRSCSSGLMNGLTSSGLNTCRANGGGLGRERLRRRRRLLPALRSSARPFLDRPERFAGQSLEDVEESGLARLRHDVDRLAVVADGQQLRRGREVVVPEVVVHGLEMPRRFPVRASSASRQLPNRLLPARSAPYRSCVGDRSGRRRCRSCDRP